MGRRTRGGAQQPVQRPAGRTDLGHPVRPATSPAYGEVDHSSTEVYQGYLAQPPDAVPAGRRRISAQLIDGTWALPDEDLLDPARHPWLNGRLLWLQIASRDRDLRVLREAIP